MEILSVIDLLHGCVLVLIFQPNIVFQEESDDSSNKPFPYPLPMDPQQQALSSIPFPLFYPALAGFVAASGFLGSIVGRAAPGTEKPQQILPP